MQVRFSEIQESKSLFLGNRESEREANRITESGRSECFWELKIETESANQPNQTVSGNFEYETKPPHRYEGCNALVVNATHVGTHVNAKGGVRRVCRNAMHMQIHSLRTGRTTKTRPTWGNRGLLRRASINLFPRGVETKSYKRDFPTRLLASSKGPL